MEGNVVCIPFFVFMKICLKDNRLFIREYGEFDLAKSCNCGQAFRWIMDGDNTWRCVIKSHPIFVEQTDECLSVFPCKESDVDSIINYFDLKRDYSQIHSMLAKDEYLKDCLNVSRGIRVFNQAPFEALISFIISANNNIKRISGIVERLCRSYGREIISNNTIFYSFPEPQDITNASIEDLKMLGMGYRAPYVKASAQKIADGYNLELLRNVPLDEARKELLSFTGVGPKVADCVLLFSLGHLNAFPIDVWIERAMRNIYFEGKQPTKQELSSIINNLGPYSGIIQQYIFYYIRSLGR